MLHIIQRSIVGLAAAVALASCATTTPKQPEPIPIKFVVVSMFEIGDVEGDQPGEFQLWKERRGLDTVLPFKNSPHDIYLNEETGVLGIITGIGTAYSASTAMALGLDPRFDLTEAYWMVAGIAGIDPEDASIGSAAWAEYLVDGDLMHHIDAREIPDDWEIGLFARHTEKPYDPNRPEPSFEVLQLNAGLTDWAYALTKDVELPDFEGLDEVRSQYTDHPNAQKPPVVMKGDQLAAMRFWHGEILNDWANKWVDYWTDGKGKFVTSAMEDTGTFLSLSLLDNLGKVDKDRVMVLRTGSNFTMPPPGVTAVDNLLAENEGYAGLDASLESAYIVGSKVMDEILDNWDTYKDRIPSVDDLP
ncbi:purine nucleoside permease [Marinimicrobium sp. ARAG 43.8]|uniref:purine nucleoside permease n=1 Tax=Marinimicrobium sp. ARAG 43.8 TaxID=3418719 RepID=UPI003CF9480D